MHADVIFRLTVAEDGAAEQGILTGFIARTNRTMVPPISADFAIALSLSNKTGP